ncbi:unnamed protein product [Calypogeia fissa]
MSAKRSKACHAAQQQQQERCQKRSTTAASELHPSRITGDRAITADTRGALLCSAQQSVCSQSVSPQSALSP